MSETGPVASDPAFVTVRTTLPSTPLLANSKRTTTCTERLTLRPLRPDDLPSFSRLRSQPEVMAWTQAGRVDANLEETKAKLALFLPPNDTKTFNCAICWKETGEMIGIGGCHKFKGEFGWPELGYMLRSDFWGKGLATEFLRGFLKMYADLPRAAVDISVRKESLSLQATGDATEVLVAVVESSNGRSHGVLNKCGLERWLVFTEADSRDPSKGVELAAYRFMLGDKS